MKGVGTVILGSVSMGIVRKHDKLRGLSGDKIVTVRSIQKHDDDCGWAVARERVGLALKGIDANELDRGFVLTSDDSMIISQSLKVQAELIRFWPTPLTEGMVFHIGHWMQFIPCRVESVSVDGDWRKPVLSLTLDRPLIHPTGAKVVITHLDGGNLRVVGMIRLP